MRGARPTSDNPLALWLLRRRRTLLDLLKRAERERTGSLPPLLRSYSRRYLMEFRATPPRPCSISQVEAAVKAADLVFSADYHASPAPERTHLRWLRALAASRRPLTLGLELVSSRDQGALDEFSRGAIGVEEVRRRIRFDRDWGFAWRPYRRLLRGARQLACRLLALDHPSRSRGATVHERDLHAGAILAREMQRRPERALLAVAGEMHLAEAHLPGSAERACRRLGLLRRKTTLFHDSEALFFSVGQHGLEGRVAALDLGEERYCIPQAAPWVRLLAHLHWLESQEPGPAPLEAEDRVVLWTARTLARLAGVRLPPRAHVPDELPAERLPFADRIARRAVEWIERLAGDGSLLSAQARDVRLALARCLVDPPVGPTAARDRPPERGARLYRRMVEGRIGFAGVRAALCGSRSDASPPRSAARARTHSSPSGS